jgi:hypothetical protein
MSCIKLNLGQIVNASITYISGSRRLLELGKIKYHIYFPPIAGTIGYNLRVDMGSISLTSRIF